MTWCKAAYALAFPWCCSRAELRTRGGGFKASCSFHVQPPGPLPPLPAARLLTQSNPTWFFVPSTEPVSSSTALTTSLSLAIISWYVAAPPAAWPQQRSFLEACGN